MTLQAQIYSLVERIADKFSGVDARIGALGQLDTAAKANLVIAINELAAKGTSSSSGVAYIHQQWAPEQVWTINHNLGVRPTVSILDSGGNEVQAEVAHMSANQLLIRFALPVSGLARLT